MSDFDEAKRKAMNELYAAGVAMRKAQREYFRFRSQGNLYAAKDAEGRFDRALDRCRNVGSQVQMKLI